MSEAQTGPTLDPERMEGQEIAGCKIVAKIATGGMGTVYRALQVSMSRQVAIKCLAEDFAKDQQYVGRFVREARAAGELSHTNLIHVMDVGVHQGVYYYIMEFVDGQSLDRVLRIKEKLGPETAVEIMIQSAKALSYAHSHDIIHRDIKPDNLMITKEGTVKIADLGIAKKLDRTRDSTDAGLVLGTPNYMAPEQATDASLTDRRSDVYALGSTAYHMLTGRPPYTGKNALEILTSVVKRKPEPIEKLRPDLPKGLLSIINKMMARDPERRYQSMDLLVKDLEQYKAGKYKSERPSARGATTWDDDDEDGVPKPKVVLELSASPQEEARQSAILKSTIAAGPPSVDGIKLSGTRVTPNPLLGSQDLIGAKAIGAINAKQTSKMIPIVTLLGAIAIGVIGWIVVKKLTAPVEDKQKGPSHTTNPTPSGPGPVLGEPEAKEALADAEKNERQPGRPRADVIKSYQEISTRWPETVAGKSAAEVANRLSKEWKDLVDSRIAEARKSLVSMGELSSIAPAVATAARARTDAQSRTDLLDLVRTLEKDIDDAALARRDAILKSARDLARQSPPRWLAAIEEARKVFLQEYPKYQDDAVKDIQAWRAKWREEREIGLVNLDRTLVDAVALFRGNEEEKRDMQSEKALQKMTEAAKDPANAAILPTMQAYAKVYKDGAAVVDLAFEQLLGLKGQMFKFSKGCLANNQAAKVVGVQRPIARVIVSGGAEISTKALTDEDIRNLAFKTLGATNQGRLQIAGYLFARGDLNASLKALDAVQGPDSEALRFMIEDFQVRVREVKAKSRDLIVSSGGIWNDAGQKGSWLLQANGKEINGSGDPLGERLLSSPPDTDYIIEVEARKELGPNGFAIYFKAMGGSYQWHVGDGGNKFSVVRGLPSTQTADFLAPGDPILARVVVLEEKAIGYINGERRWQITRATPGSPDPGPGVGLGVSHTLVRFKQLRLYNFIKDSK